MRQSLNWKKISHHNKQGRKGNLESHTVPDILDFMKDYINPTKDNFLLIEHGGSRKQFSLDVLLEDPDL